ncbi:MAG: hypothetical protein AAF266_12640 [Planctomycetota bacterium]
MPQPPANPNRDDAPLNERDAAIERLLDLPAGERDGLVDTPEAVTAVLQQEEIDASLRRQFAAPELPASLLARLGADSTAEAPAGPAASVTLPTDSPAKPRRTLPNWAVAAVLLLGVGAWLFQARNFFAPDDSGYEQIGVVAIYQAEVDRGFEPDWFCEDEKRFADTFAERQGEGVWLRSLPEGVEMVGLAYLKGLTAEATSLMARADGEPVLVVVERTEKVPGRLLRPDKDSDIKIFSQQFGDLMAIEITPFDEPRVAPSLYLREPPAEPTGRVPGS